MLKLRKALVLILKVAGNIIGGVIVAVAVTSIAQLGYIDAAAKVISGIIAH